MGQLGLGHVVRSIFDSLFCLHKFRKVALFWWLIRSFILRREISNADGLSICLECNAGKQIDAVEKRISKVAYRDLLWN